MSFCPNCGSPVQPGSATCAKCGGPSSVPAAPPAPVYVTPPNPGFSPGGFGPSCTPGLPDPSPLALILGAAAWVVGCGPFLSVPALIKARADIRGINEGRLNPSGLGMCQAAFWISVINVVLYGLLFIFILLMVALGMFAGLAASSHHVGSPRAPVTTAPARGGATVVSYETLEREIETRMEPRPEGEVKLWRQAKDDLRKMRKAGGAGAAPAVKGLDALLAATASDERLWSSLVELEQKAYEEAGRPAPSRARPAAPAEREAGD